MNPGAANTDNFFNFKINHDVAVTGYPMHLKKAKRISYLKANRQVVMKDLKYGELIGQKK
ncbi:MAG: hypothetical protein LKM45_05535 [Wolbachia endosymbiont of Alcedoecus sp.]|nr:hypothetical protein [Wolbachia endosymbiont of Alcedoecus sp.]